MLLQLAEFSCGKQCLNELDDPLLYTSCGDILEQLQQPLEAAEPYLKAGNESASKFLDLLVEEEKGARSIASLFQLLTSLISVD